MLLGDDVPWRDREYLTIIRIQSVLGAAYVWRMAMRWHLRVFGGTRCDIS